MSDLGHKQHYFETKLAWLGFFSLIVLAIIIFLVFI